MKHPSVLSYLLSGWEALSPGLKSSWLEPMRECKNTRFSHSITNWTSWADVASEELLKRRDACDTEDQEEYITDLMSDMMSHEGELFDLPELPEEVHPECPGHIAARNHDISHMVLDIFLHQVRSDAMDWLEHKIEEQGGVLFLKSFLEGKKLCAFVEIGIESGRTDSEM